MLKYLPLQNTGWPTLICLKDTFAYVHVFKGKTRQECFQDAASPLKKPPGHSLSLDSVSLSLTHLDEMLPLAG